MEIKYSVEQMTLYLFQNCDILYKELNNNHFSRHSDFTFQTFDRLWSDSVSDTKYASGM